MRSHFVVQTGLFLLFALFAAAVSAQPPAIGPDTYKVDKTDISALTLRNFARTQIDQVLATTNTTLKNQGHGNIHVTREGDVTFHAPYRLASDNPRTPNSYYVKVPMNFKVNLDIPGFDRQLYYPLDLNVSCDGWYMPGGGTLKVTAVVGPPDIQGGSIVENVLMIRDMIDNYIKARLPVIGSIASSLPGKCMTLGASTGIEAQNSFIAWDTPGGRIVTGIGRLGPYIEVTYERLKRLAARGNGQMLYNTVETVQLDTYANYTERQAQSLTFREGDTVNLNIPKVILDGPLPNVLVIIASIDQSGGSQDDTAFASAPSSANFSPGEHTIQIPKTYIIPPGHGSTKPTIVHTPGYELTYNVKVVNPTTIFNPGRVQ
ncbi:MAG: hypothetical protein JO053_05240 [Acidobacteria bacterium]|nr:hypothetical protein [Acidobacteriota bacterium]